MLNENTEWKFDLLIFQKILKLFSVKSETDIFASHLNYHVPTYISRNPDKNAYAIDAFSISRVNLKFYAFPPFSLIGASISMIRREMAAGIMIILPCHGGDTVLVSDDGASFPRFPSITSSESFDNTIQHTIATSLVSENETAGSSFIGKAFRHIEFPSEVTNVILESWQSSVRFRYELVLKT